MSQAMAHKYNMKCLAGQSKSSGHVSKKLHELLNCMIPMIGMELI